MRQIYALHGFLGLPSDWHYLQNFSLIPYDHLLHPPSPTNGLKEWGAQFNRIVDPLLPKVLMGYSLGGRLAMHALTQKPELWSAAILISCHPGLSCPIKKHERLKKDCDWAERFEKEPWDSLMLQWNAQEPFKFSPPQKREENNYSRKQLSDVLRYWSLGNQDHLTPLLQNLTIPILWIAGKQDFAYASLAQSMSFAHPQSKIWIAENAGHRVPWESNDFNKVVTEFYHTIG